MAQILIIEDEVLLAKSLSRSLAAAGHDCVTSVSAEEGLSMLERSPSDIVLLDLQLPGMSGLEAIKHIRELDANISVIIATAHATMAAAVEAMRAGACDLLRKPLDAEEVRLAVERAISEARLRQTISYYQHVESDRVDEDRLVCNSRPMQQVSQIISRILAKDLPSSSEYPPVLVLGETGTGKDLVARIIHFRSTFHDKPFIEVNCSTLPKGLEEAELFGYERGAFTGAERSKRGLFEAGSGGTVFLNEIGDLTPEAQVKLLQAIEQRSIRRVGGLRDVEVDVRIIAATHRDLSASGQFRQDLYYRLHNLTVQLPPLRERQDDIVELAEFFLQRFGHKYGALKTLSDDARSVMRAYSWPGNVRELRQLMERITFLDTGTEITPAELNLGPPAAVTTRQPGEDLWPFPIPSGGIDLEALERELIQKALAQTQGNVSRAAQLLRIGREALRYRIQKYRLAPK